MMMTRPACARVRQLVAVWLGCVVGLCASASARAQARAELERALTVTRELPGCVSASALRARTAQYVGRIEQLPELTIEVDLQVPQFRVLRDGTLLAERRFARAPSDCSERRDALALALAIAIEQVAEETAATSGKADAASSRAEGDSTGPIAASERDDLQGGERATRDARSDPRGAGERDDVQGGGRATRDARSDARDDAQSSGRAGAGTAPSSARDAGDTQRRGDARSGGRVGADDARSSARDAGDAGNGGRVGGDAALAASGAADAGSSEHGAPPSAADGGALAALALTREGRPRASVAVLGGGTLLVAALPTAAPAFSLGAELALLPALRIALSGLLSLPVSSEFQGGTVSAQLFGAQLTTCANTALFASVLLHGCAGAVGGVIQARGDDFALNLSDQMGWLAGLVRARLEFPAAGLVAAGVYADARVNLLRPELQAGLASEPARTRAVGLFGAALGVELIVRLH